MRKVNIKPKQQTDLNNMTNTEAVAMKCLKQVRNKLYFQHKALSPAIYRMPIVFNPMFVGADTETALNLLHINPKDMNPGFAPIGTDAENIYVDPFDTVIRYKESPEKLSRVYLHMIFHCIYLHPFMQPGKNADIDLWNLAMDICCEAAIRRLENIKPIDGDGERGRILNDINGRIKIFLPNLVYKELEGNPSYDIANLENLFCVDTHYWLQEGEREDEDNSSNDSSNGDNGGNGNDSGSNGGNQNENQNKSKSQNQNNENPSGSDSTKQKWKDTAMQIAADMQSFHKGQGTEAGNTAQEIDFLTQDKMDYEEFLRTFAVMEEKMMVNQDEFDYMYYMYGLNGMPDAHGNKSDKKVLLIEPLEYKEEKVIKDFVIAIDTSGSCAGELVQKFLRKTYSILKETESFSNRVNIHIIQCDASIQNDTKITNMREMETFMQNMRLYGFGGTDFRPVFEYVDTLIKEKEFDNLCGLIYFTDGYGTYPTKPTPYKTAFAFLEDYNIRDVPSWAMSVTWDENEQQ